LAVIEKSIGINSSAAVAVNAYLKDHGLHVPALVERALEE
jgi:hypothetical protein